MTNEEYLRVCGWRLDPSAVGSISGPKPPWHHPLQRGMFTEEQAVEAQLAEDRARFEFVMALTPPRADTPRSIDPSFYIDLDKRR